MLIDGISKSEFTSSNLIGWDNCINWFVFVNIPTTCSSSTILNAGLHGISGSALRFLLLLSNLFKNLTVSSYVFHKLKSVMKT